jgi:hypothetical protein
MRLCEETTVLSSLDTQFIFDPGVLAGMLDEGHLLRNNLSKT